MPAGSPFLPGVPAEHVLERLAKAGGNEVESGKLTSPESSAALAVNAFGWFIERPERLPPFLGSAAFSWPATAVEVEVCARFPWSGGRHPWLDAWVEMAGTIIGIESKRFEPFRDVKTTQLSEAYDRPVWGDRMRPFEALRDELRSGALSFRHLDAAQLVKHAFGLVTEGRRRGTTAVLLYLFAEPAARAGRAIPRSDIDRHREEAALFASRVCGSEVAFAAVSYREWLDAWPSEDAELCAHRDRITDVFAP